ncbi:YlxR family protein [bacterium]|nr:YlxR family protein [bacterium]
MRDALHVPIRTCMGCGAAAPQGGLLRVVRAADGALALDVSRRAGGRGGYLHRRRDCWDRFAKRKGPLRSLRATVDRPARAALVAALLSDAGE